MKEAPPGQGGASDVTGYGESSDLEDIPYVNQLSINDRRATNSRPVYPPKRRHCPAKNMGCPLPALDPDYLRPVLFDFLILV